MSASDTVAGAVPGDESMLAAAGELLQAAGSRLRNTVALAAAEARLAAMAGLTMLILVVLTACFVLVGWGLMVAAAVSLAANAGISWATIAFGASVLHLLAALLLFLWAMRLSRHLTLPALREALWSDETAAAE